MFPNKAALEQNENHCLAQVNNINENKNVSQNFV